jgi:hypothetical protein
VPDTPAGATSKPARWFASLRNLSWADRWLLVHAFFVVTAFGVLVRAFTLRQVHAWVAPRGVRSHRDPPGDARRVRAIADIVAMASRRSSLSDSCLYRSLALWWLLRRQGFDGRLRLGARQQDGRFDAHAWVEHDGVVLLDDPAAVRGYAELPWIVTESRS